MSLALSCTYLQTLQVTPDDSHQPVPLTTFVEDAVSLCVLVNGKALPTDDTAK